MQTIRSRVTDAKDTESRKRARSAEPCHSLSDVRSSKVSNVPRGMRRDSQAEQLLELLESSHDSIMRSST